MRTLNRGLVPHKDMQGTFHDLDTPIAEQKVNDANVKGKQISRASRSRFTRGQTDRQDESLKQLN